MSRYTGPRLKKVRAIGVDLPGLTRKSLERRPYPPGVHGVKSRRKPSVFGLQLVEKQKLRFNYGLRERQLRKVLKEALRSRENPGEKLVEYLERRLDNAIFRAGFAPTIPAARQLVSHGHVRVNGSKVNIPSYRLKKGQSITLSEKALKLPVVVSTLENPPIKRPNWLGFAGNLATVNENPTQEEIGFPLDIQLVIEFYSRRVKK